MKTPEGWRLFGESPFGGTVFVGRDKLTVCYEPRPPEAYGFPALHLSISRDGKPPKLESEIMEVTAVFVPLDAVQESIEALTKEGERRLMQMMGMKFTHQGMRVYGDSSVNLIYRLVSLPVLQ